MAGEADRPYKANIPHAMHLVVRHLPNVVEHCKQIADKGAKIGGPNWHVVVQNAPDTKRPRAYIAPIDQAEAEADDAKNSTVYRIISGLRGQ